MAARTCHGAPGVLTSPMPTTCAKLVLFVTDIFGHTPEAQALARQLGGSVRIVSPYGSDRPRFASEMEAYAAFSAASSVEVFATVVAGELARARYDLAVGFSAGASALWLALGMTMWRALDKASAPPAQSVLYYGSRIRQHAELRPAGNAHLIFAEREASFNPAELVATLHAGGVNAEVLPGTAHGFMNRLSPGWDEAACAAEVARLRGLLCTGGTGA